MPWQLQKEGETHAFTSRHITTQAHRNVNDETIGFTAGILEKHENTNKKINFEGASLMRSSLDNLHLEMDSKLRLTALPLTTSNTLADGRPPSGTYSYLFSLAPDPIPFNLKSSPSSIIPTVGDFPSSSIAPSLPLRGQIEIREPTGNLTVVISDGRKSQPVVGDQSPSATQEVIGDKMDNVIQKEAIRILQIRRTKMNKHKLRKWRRKFRHLIKKRIEEREKAEQKELDDTVARIRANADEFNPVDKVRHHIALAKEMGYRVTYYEELPLTKWLKEKEAEDAANAQRFDFRNRDRYRKYPPWETEKF